LTPASFLLAFTLFATAFPSNSLTSWMRPESFRLGIGMSRTDALSAIKAGGWEAKKGANDDQMVVDYGDDKAMTLEFNRGRLHGVRFEYHAMIPDARKAFAEEKGYLEKTYGAPARAGRQKAIVIYDNILPNIVVVLSDDPTTAQGKQGLGLLAVRYYDPVPPKK
jgi:hypothetical protein